MRCSDPLAPSYRDLDGGAYGAVPAKIPKPGQTFPRSPSEAFGLITADISASGPRTTEYPKHLIKTRETNKIDDISGAQAGTMPTSGPRLWARDPDNPHKPPRDPSKVSTRPRLDGAASAKQNPLPLSDSSHVSSHVGARKGNQQGRGHRWRRLWHRGNQGDGARAHVQEATSSPGPDKRAGSSRRHCCGETDLAERGSEGSRCCSRGGAVVRTEATSSGRRGYPAMPPPFPCQSDPLTALVSPPGRVFRDSRIHFCVHA